MESKTSEVWVKPDISVIGTTTSLSLWRVLLWTPFVQRGALRRTQIMNGLCPALNSALV